MAGPIIEHRGTVLSVEAECVRVRMTVDSACGSCRARGACGMSESQEKIVEVWTADAGRYATGDEVVVGVRRSMGGRAVLIGYVGALVVLLAVLVGTIGGLGWSEGAGALASLGGVALYYTVLRMLRGVIDETIHFTITRR